MVDGCAVVHGRVCITGDQCEGVLDRMGKRGVGSRVWYGFGI